MLKITPAMGHRFNVSHNGEPVMLKDLKLSDEAVNQIDEMLHSFGELPHGGKIAFLVYEGGMVTFFAHSSVGDIPVYLANFPEELLEHLAQIKVAVKRCIVIEANSS